MNSPFMWGDNFFRSLGTCALGFFFYCSVSLFAFVVGLVGGAGVSAVGTTLLQSPGWNEGKARNATLGKHGQKRIELRRSGTFSESICRGLVPPLWGSIYVD